MAVKETVEEWRKRMLGGKTREEWLHHQMVNNPNSPHYVPKRKNDNPERDLQNEVKKWLIEHDVTFLELVVKPSTMMQGGKLVRIPSPMVGWPDIILIVNGKFLGCELKIQSVQSDAQKAAQAKIEKGGGTYRICRSVEDVEKLISECMPP